MCNLAVAIRYQHQAFLLKLLKNRPADDEIFESLEIAVLIISIYKTEHFKWNTTLKLLYIRYWLRKGISLSINFDYQFLIFNMYKQIQKWILHYHLLNTNEAWNITKGIFLIQCSSKNTVILFWQPQSILEF